MRNEEGKAAAGMELTEQLLTPNCALRTYTSHFSFLIFGRGRFMYLYQLGWHWKHPPSFVIERPNGLHGMQLLLIQSKARIRMGTKEYNVQPNTAFLVKSSLPHALYADGCEYMDDWIRFSPEQDDHAFLDSLEIAWNMPIPLADDTVSKLIASCEDIFNSDLQHKNRILHHTMTAILLYLSEFTHPASGKKNFYDEKLDGVRREIYKNPGSDWSIPQIAGKLCVSVSHFQRLYKARFGVSCTQDIFTSRMEYAKQLLLETMLPAAEISEMCGFQNYEYFSRTFAKYACVSPARFRAENQEGAV